MEKSKWHSHRSFESICLENFFFLFGRDFILYFSLVKHWVYFRALWEPECCLLLPPLVFLTHLFSLTPSLLEINWINYPRREEKKTLTKSSKKWLSQVTKDLRVNEVLLTREVRASDVNKPGNCMGSLGTVRKSEARPPWMWLICLRTGVLARPLSASTHLPFLLTFTLEDDAQSICDLSLKCCVSHSLSDIATPQKLSSDWQSIHSFLNLSACVILSDAFAPKQSPLWQLLLRLLELFLRVRREENNENSFSWYLWLWQPHSHDSLLRTPLKFQGLRRILQMTCIYFSLKKEICFIDVIAKTHRVRRNMQLCWSLGSQLSFLNLESLSNDLFDLHRWASEGSRDLRTQAVWDKDLGLCFLRIHLGPDSG